MIKISTVFSFILLIPNGRSYGSFSRRGNWRDRLFPPAICGGFNFRAIVDYVRRDHTRAARSHQRRSPVPYLEPAFLIRIQLFSQRPPLRGFSIYEINCYTAGALAVGKKKKKKRELYRRTGSRVSIIWLARRIVLASKYFCFTDRSIFLT